MFFILVTVIVHVLRYYNCQCTDGDTCPSNEDDRLRGCYCDDKCLSYKDCCKEYISSRLMDNRSSLSLDSTNHDGSLMNQACVLLYDPIRKSSNRVGAFMVDKCLANNKKCLVEEGKFETMLPVTNGFTTYRNAECAICNGARDFEYWTIVYNVLDERELLSFSSGGDFIDEQNVIDKLHHGDSNGKEYFLKPPHDYNLRLCPYDVLPSLAGMEPIGEIIAHQNVVSCNGSLYKNFELCKRKGCCKTSDVKCSEFALPYFSDLGTSFKQLRGSGIVPAGIRVILKYTPSNPPDSAKVLARVPRISYIHMYVNILVKIQQMNTHSFNLNECVHGLIAYLGNTKYRLFPQHSMYSYVSARQNLHDVFIPLRVAEKLEEEDVNALLQLKQSIMIERQDVITASGELNVISFNDTEKSPFGELHRHIQRTTIINEYIRPKTRHTYPTCNNMMVTFESEKPGPRIVVEGKCMDKRLPDNVACCHKAWMNLILSIFAFVQYHLNLY